jgi:hypothetical protein
METIIGNYTELTKKLPSYEENKYIIYGIVFLAIFAVIYLLRDSIINYSNTDGSNNSNKIEHMSGGTLQQLFAQDAQDVNLNGKMSENNNLAFNLPTKVLQGTQRGAPMSCNNIDTETVLAYTGDSGMAPFPYITPPSVVKQG